MSFLLIPRICHFLYAIENFRSAICISDANYCFNVFRSNSGEFPFFILPLIKGNELDQFLVYIFGEPFSFTYQTDFLSNKFEEGLILWMDLP